MSEERKCRARIGVRRARVRAPFVSFVSFVVTLPPSYPYSRQL